MYKEKGYFTVEAAMVFPVAFAIVILVMYLMFFQYNRCLMEQDAGIIALYGAAVTAESNEERIAQVRRKMAEMDEEKYIAWAGDEVKLKLEKGKMVVAVEGGTVIPFVKSQGGVLTETTFQNSVFRPASVIRLFRKVMGGEE